MKKFILASASALALLTVAACSDSTDTATTQSTTPAPADQSQPAQPQVEPQAPATDGTTTESIKPTRDGHGRRDADHAGRPGAYRAGAARSRPVAASPSAPARGKRRPVRQRRRALPGDLAWARTEEG